VDTEKNHAIFTVFGHRLLQSGDPAAPWRAARQRTRLPVDAVTCGDSG